MKKVTEKDLSLDEQVVSNLNSNADTRDETNNELICASNVCTDSHFEICCGATKEENCIASEACVSVNDCPATDDTQCGICSNTPGCGIPIPETDRCTVGLC